MGTQKFRQEEERRLWKLRGKTCSKIVFLCWLLYSPPSFSQANAEKCSTVPAKSLREGFPSLGENLNTLIMKIKSSFQDDAPEDLVSLFHKRLKITEPRLRGIFTIIKAKLKTPLEVSVYKVLSLHSPDQSSRFLECPGEEIRIRTLYGYSLQYGVWIQLLGKKELGRVFIHLIPDKTVWKIGSFHYEQSTHNAKAAQDWFRLALSHLEKDPLLAFAEFDIAGKLSVDTPHYQWKEHSEILSKQESALKRKDWEMRIKTLVPAWKLVYLGTILSETGVGLAIRFQVPKELSTNAVRDECQKLWTSIKNTKELSGFNGIRCSILLPQESPQNDGIMGFQVLEK